MLEHIFRLCIKRKESAGSEWRKPASVSECSPPGRISICHTAISVTVWRTTGRLSTKNRQWRRVYSSSRQRVAKSPNKWKDLEGAYGRWTSHQDLPYLINATSCKRCNPGMPQVVQIAVVGPSNSNGYENIVSSSELTRDDIHGWFLNISPDFRASKVQRRFSINARGGQRQWADSFLTNVHKQQTATCLTFRTSCFFVWYAFPLQYRLNTWLQREGAPTFVGCTTSCTERGGTCLTAASIKVVIFFAQRNQLKAT